MQYNFKIKNNTNINAGLYIVSTPIGNTQDITLRALNVLDQAEFIACEDTRVTGKLLNLFNIKAKLKSYHEYNAPRVRPLLIEILKRGQTVALVSDAGTPLISDPGLKLVQACYESNIPVIPIPGASAILSALVVAGLPTDRFFFVGFLPNKKNARLNSLKMLSKIPATLVFMESPRRFSGFLSDASKIIGSRLCVIARELTKIHEEVRRGTVKELALFYQNEEAPKGEGMVLIGPPSEEEKNKSKDLLDEEIKIALKSKTLRDTVSIVVKKTGLTKKTVYSKALEISKSLKK